MTMHNLSAKSRWIINSIDVHCHGVGRFDFTEIPQLHLDEIENILASRNHHCILTLYLPKPSFNSFLNLMHHYSDAKRQGKYPHIMGISIEGPLLASHGGTPIEGVWNPSKAEWRALADCGQLGLTYAIFSPDAKLSEYDKTSGNDKPAGSVTWIAETLLKGGVMPAPGHFLKDNQQDSANKLQALFDVVKGSDFGITMTDHLFNDMPNAFKHAWRGHKEKSHRYTELQNLNMGSWCHENLEEKLGPVPAIMIRNALQGIVKIAINFDGEHVDLAVVKKAVELIGAENVLMMTDSIESKCLAGRSLHTQPDSTLLYQDDGIVAAGSQNINRQIENMICMGLSEKQINCISHLVPQQLLTRHNSYRHAQMHFV